MYFNIFHHCNFMIDHKKIYIENKKKLFHLTKNARKLKLGAYKIWRISPVCMCHGVGLAVSICRCAFARKK